MAINLLINNQAKLPYRHCLKNVCGHRRHPRSAVAYSEEVAHRAVSKCISITQ